MALKVELKPGERIILGDCVITNDGSRSNLLIEGQVAVLRDQRAQPVDRGLGRGEERAGCGRFQAEL